MPDAIITSTESTFGTISGTFAADQSTISGTILGPVAGNLSGSVGVPGPAGVGVPAGGLEGQIIVKASDTDYDTVWADNSAETLTATVRNETGATLTKGTVVYINGAAGNKATVTKASASSESGSSKTFAILKDDILNNQNGTAVTVGLLKGVDTSAFSPGANLWLSTTAGQITQTPPTSPNHAVFLGNAVRIHANQGEIEVRIQNGYELGELHDVLIHDVANGQVLKYDSAQGLWVNGTDVGGVAWGGITGTLSDQTDLQSALDAKYDASNPSGFITSSALSPYLTTASASATYQTLSGMADYLSKAGNLSGLASVSTARDNLGLGSLSTPTFAGVTVQGSGSNVANLTPTSLSLTHATSGSFVIQPSVGITFPDATVQTTAYPGPPGATTWGSITGTLSSQTDLQTALDGKYSTSNPAGYITSSALTGYATESFVTSQGYITSAALSPYLLSSTAASTYQTIAGMSSYLTTSAAASTYYPLTNPSGYITSSALAGYATESWVTAGFYPLSSNPAGYLTSASLSGYATESWVSSQLGSYLTTSAAASTYLTQSNAASTYQTIAGMSSYLTTATAASTYAPLASPALTGNVTITTNSASPALFITQTGTGNILTLHDQAADTTFVAIDQNGKVNTIPSTTANAGFNVPHGTAPTSPVNGDIWTTTGGIFWRQNGTTQQAVDLGGTQTISGIKTFSASSLTFGSSTSAGSINVATGAIASGTKTVNIGSGGTSGSTTNINIGTNSGGNSTVTVNALLSTRASATTGSGLRVPHGTAPTSPTNGDIWTDTANVYARVNGVTQTLVSPPFATTAEINSPSATDKVVSPWDVVRMITNRAVFDTQSSSPTFSTSGSGAEAYKRTNDRVIWVGTPSVGVAGWGQMVYETTASQIGIFGAKRGSVLEVQDYNKKIWMSGTTIFNSIGDANTTCRLMLGGRNTLTTGSPTTKNSVGWRLTGGGGNPLVLVTYGWNGSALVVTETTSTFTPVVNQTFDWTIYHSPNVANPATSYCYLYVNDTLVATGINSPADGIVSFNYYVATCEATASQATRMTAQFLPTRIWWSRS